MRRRQHAARAQHASHFGERSLDVEVHPALAGDDGVEARVGEGNRLRGGDDEVDREPFAGRALARRGDLAGGDVDAADDAAAARELARDESGAGAEVEHTLAGGADAERCEQVVEARRRARPVARVVGGGAAPVDRAAAVEAGVAGGVAGHDTGHSTHIRSGCFMRPAAASASSPQPQK